MSVKKLREISAEPDDVLICRRLKDLSHTYTKFAVAKMLFCNEGGSQILCRHINNLIRTYGEAAILTNWQAMYR